MEPARVWTRQRPSPPRRAPDVARIVAVAVSIADAEGLGAVSMRRVATELGSGTASLYRYVTSRDELVELMIDAARGEDLPGEPSGDWRADLATVAHRSRASLLRHPWLGAELTGRPPLGPNSLRWADSALAAVAPLDVDATRAVLVVDTVFGYVLGAVTTELAGQEAQRRSGLSREQWQAGVGPYIRSVIDAGEHPHFARRVIDADEVDAAERFEFGLGCVLDGVEARTGGTTGRDGRRRHG